MKLKIKSEQGFTLIEVISVLVILAILMAVAIPKYINLIEQAKVKTIEYALGTGCSTVTMVYAKQILLTGKPPDVAALCDILNNVGFGHTTVGDFTVAYATTGTTGVKVTVTKSNTFEMPAAGGPFERTVILVSDG